MTKENVLREANRIVESQGFDLKQMRGAAGDRIIPLTGHEASPRFTNWGIGVNVESGHITLSASGEFEGKAMATESSIALLESRLVALEREVEALKRAALEDQEPSVVVLRAIPREQAKQEIRQLFSLGETLYYSDIVERLGLDIALVIELCGELEAEGEVMTLGNTT